jgi:hypothetical protein
LCSKWGTGELSPGAPRGQRKLAEFSLGTGEIFAFCPWGQRSLRSPAAGTGEVFAIAATLAPVRVGLASSRWLIVGFGWRWGFLLGFWGSYGQAIGEICALLQTLASLRINGGQGDPKKALKKILPAICRCTDLLGYDGGGKIFLQNCFIFCFLRNFASFFFISRRSFSYCAFTQSGSPMK